MFMTEEKTFQKFILTTEQVMQALDRAVAEVEVPEWTTPEMSELGQVAYVQLRALSTQQRDDLYRLCSDTGQPGGKLDSLRFMRLVVVYGMVEPKLTEEHLLHRAFGVIDRLATHVMEMSGMGRNVAASAALTFRPEPGPGVSVPPGSGTPHAGG